MNEIKCPECGKMATAEFVDVGFGEINGVQAGPYYCEACQWIEPGCPTGSKDNCKKCVSEWYCQGKSLE